MSQEPVQPGGQEEAGAVRHKIAPVIDDLCELCAQHWRGECRAFQAPHSEEERAQRQGDPQGLCQISVLRWTYEIGHPERRKPGQESVEES